MDVHGVLLAVVLLLSIYTDQDNAQVNCYADSPCEGPVLMADETPHTCCMLDAAVAFQRVGEGEVCEKCLIYGWMNTFPIEVEKGQVVNLEVGYNKGAPAIRRRVMVEYDDSEITVEPDDFQLISSTIIQTVQVTVLDDGLPIAEDKTITLTLTFSGVDTDDIVLGEALLIIPGRQVTPVRVVKTMIFT